MCVFPHSCVTATGSGSSAHGLILSQSQVKRGQTSSFRYLFQNKSRVVMVLMRYFYCKKSSRPLRVYSLTQLLYKLILPFSTAQQLKRSQRILATATVAKIWLINFHTVGQQIKDQIKYRNLHSKNKHENLSLGTTMKTQKLDWNGNLITSIFKYLTVAYFMTRHLVACYTGRVLQMGQISHGGPCRRLTLYVHIEV